MSIDAAILILISLIVSALGAMAGALVGGWLVNRRADEDED